jgi:hypothetical protein
MVIKELSISNHLDIRSVEYPVQMFERSNTLDFDKNFGEKADRVHVIEPNDYAR